MFQIQFESSDAETRARALVWTEAEALCRHAGHFSVGVVAEARARVWARCPRKGGVRRESEVAQQSVAHGVSDGATRERALGAMSKWLPATMESDPGKATKLLIREQPQRVLRPLSRSVSPCHRAFVFEGVAVHTYLEGASS